MFNDIFGEVLWKCLTKIKPPGPGEMKAKRKKESFFSNVVFHNFWKYSKISV